MKLLRTLDDRGHPQTAALQPDGSARLVRGDVFGAYEVTEEPVTPGTLLAPFAPTQIIGIGLNYRRHAEESGAKVPERPVVFFKGLNTVQHPGGPIVLPRHLRSDEVDYECELGVVIGKPCKNVGPEEALGHVLGYVCANDVSARDWQLRWGGSQWSRGKSFDTFTPLGPYLVTADSIPDPNALGIRTRLNGETVQDWTTEDMIFSVPEIISFLSGSTTLLPGTLILTGTPHGVGMARTPPRYLRAGDTVTVEIDGLGALTNPVEEEPVGGRRQGEGE